MVKISRPILYIALLGVGAYAVVLLTEPEATPKKKTTRPATTAAKLQGDITEADLKAHFTRYAGAGKDAFAPAVLPRRGAKSAVVSAQPAKELTAAVGNWNLTGITVMDDVRNAVMESSAHDIVFLKEGDRWNGLRVAAVEMDAVVLTNPLGKQIRLTFVEPKPETGVPSPTSPTGGSTPPASAPFGQPRSTVTSRANREDNVN